MKDHIYRPRRLLSIFAKANAAKTEADLREFQAEASR